MLHAKLPCRHSVGWGTCHAGPTGHSRFDHECRGWDACETEGKRAGATGPRDQEDANTEGGLASMSQDSADRDGAAARQADRGARRRRSRRRAALQRRPHLRELHPALRLRHRPAGRGSSPLPPAGVRRRGRTAAHHRRTRTDRAVRPGGDSPGPAPWWCPPGGRSPQPPPAEALDALRRAHEEGARIVGLCTGAFVLAAAGLLDGRPATTHWMYAPTLAKRYPSVHVDPRELFVDDGDVLTSAGTAAGIDLCLHIVRTDHGTEAAGALARRLVVPPRRAAGGQAALPGQVFTRGDRRRPAGRGRRLGAGAPPRAVRRGDAGRARLHEPADLRPAGSAR